MKKFTVWIKKHKKLAVFLCIAIIIAAAVLTIRHKAQAAMAQLAELTEETAVVEKRSIQSSVSSTGTIISDKTRSITATLTGMEVLTVDVEVGDVVQEGDTICTFDTSKLEDTLEDAEKSLSAAKTQTSVTVNNAKRALEQAIETQNYQIESAARNVILRPLTTKLTGLDASVKSLPAPICATPCSSSTASVWARPSAP